MKKEIPKKVPKKVTVYRIVLVTFLLSGSFVLEDRTLFKVIFIIGLNQSPTLIKIDPFNFLVMKINLLSIKETFREIYKLPSNLSPPPPPPFIPPPNTK